MGKRPPSVKAPKHLSKSPPVPEPKEVEYEAKTEGKDMERDPVRYGDWELKGIAVDF
ncbi:MAG: DUF1674 domain-containing protein [Sphingorhabdus sp.]